MILRILDLATATFKFLVFIALCYLAGMGALLVMDYITWEIVSR